MHIYMRDESDLWCNASYESCGCELSGFKIDFCTPKMQAWKSGSYLFHFLFPFCTFESNNLALFIEPFSALFSLSLAITAYLQEAR